MTYWPLDRELVGEREISAVADVSGLELGEGTEPEEAFEVSRFPCFDYSMKDVKRAGEIIAGPLDASDPNVQHCVEAFRIANNWRDAHAYPMRSVRASMNWHMKKTLNIEGVTAARLKRMQAIRRKLRRIQLNLNQIQDLGGCRSIVGSVADVDAIAGVLLDKRRHCLHKENDYIVEPKEKDGYRSRHLILEYRGRGEASVFNDRRIEVQIRTALQHSWATTVEAIGSFRGEELKSNMGDDRWLRFFKLMSAEFARIENCPLPPGLPGRTEIIAEIKHLNKDLLAIETLDNLKNAVRWVDDAIEIGDRPPYYLIIYDNASRQVKIQPYFDPLHAVKSYDQAELKDNENDTATKNIVLVEAGRVAQLKAAYPNYFGDVSKFTQNLKRICSGKDAIEYALIPQERAPRPPGESHTDPAWLRRRGRWN